MAAKVINMPTKTAAGAAPADAPEKKGLFSFLIIVGGVGVAYLLWQKSRDEERLETALARAEARAAVEQETAGPSIPYAPMPAIYTYQPPPPRWGWPH
jgi:hypothetical protein